MYQALLPLFLSFGRWGLGTRLVKNFVGFSNNSVLHCAEVSEPGDLVRFLEEWRTPRFCCIVYIGMACIIIEMMTSVLQSILHYTSSRKTSFHAKFQVTQFTCFDISTACIIVRTDNHQFFKENYMH